jgi:hypothetical protein
VRRDERLNQQCLNAFGFDEDRVSLAELADESRAPIGQARLLYETRCHRYGGCCRRRGIYAVLDCCVRFSRLHVSVASHATVASSGRATDPARADFGTEQACPRHYCRPPCRHTPEEDALGEEARCAVPNRTTSLRGKQPAPNSAGTPYPTSRAVKMAARPAHCEQSHASSGVRRERPGSLTCRSAGNDLRHHHRRGKS